ncbi:hypothetical protein Tsubulata_034375 [Turnera subulata]|uniref:FLZ-type domain-containing protein n=1 Tax=Turnera subulata TaxID=218843 RepID=A0A9Q0G876_9ROSI|nr:hypothetical protein Tsubulata_034375 [Turnera subulata]
MLRNRPRAVTSKQGLMSDNHISQSSSPQNHKKPITSLFGTPPRLGGFTLSNGLPDTEPVMSPTSILGHTTKPFSSFKNPFFRDMNQPRSPKVVVSEKKCSWEKLESKGIGVALIDYAPTDKPNKDDSFSSKPAGNRMVLFGTKLKVQIPPLLPNSTLSPAESPRSPAEFGIKTRNPQLCATTGAGNCTGIQAKDSPRVFTGCLTLSEMELSEDYTCVISRGPTPRTTHIFDNCIVENYCSLSDKSCSSPKDFLSFCFTCKKNLEQKNDIYIYRGEKAFCSHECRYQEMLLDGIEN